jgi:uncharacterized membrane protein YkoI
LSAACKDRERKYEQEKERYEMPIVDPRAIFLAVTSCLVASHVVLAGSSELRDRGDHDRARLAFQQGEIRSLNALMAELRSDLAGEVIEVELRNNRGTYFYKFKVLAPDGRLGELSVDAASGKIVERE